MTFLESLGEQRLLPVLRLPDPDAVLAAARSMVEAGLDLLELTATTPGWRQAVAAVQEQCPTTTIGLGTVTTAATARAALDAGVAFLVSPWPAPEVREVAEAADTPFLEGAFSPAEIARAAQLGPVKVFPAHLGGLPYLRSLRRVLPDAFLVPTGGVAVSDAAAWLGAGASAVGVGRDLLDGDVRDRVVQVMRIARADRQRP